MLRYFPRGFQGHIGHDLIDVPNIFVVIVERLGPPAPGVVSAGDNADALYFSANGLPRDL